MGMVNWFLTMVVLLRQILFFSLQMKRMLKRKQRDMMANNAFERTVNQRGPHLAAARSSGPAVQLGR